MQARSHIIHRNHIHGNIANKYTPPLFQITCYKYMIHAYLDKSVTFNSGQRE
jgi:hypothetical protein